MESKSTDWRPGNTVCRCCLTEGCYKDISTEYFWMGKREVYSEMLTETFDLNIAFSKSGGPNSNSRLICEPCISRLRDASDFKRQVQECERTFMQFLDPGSSGVMTEVELDKEVKIEAVKLEEASDEDLFDDRDFGTMDDDDDDDLDDQPLTKLASKIPKKESVDIMELLDSAKVGDKRKASTKLKVSPTKKVSSRIIKITGKEVKVKNKKLLVKATTSSKEPKATVSKLTVKPEKKKKDLPATTRQGPRTSIWQMTISERQNAATFIEFTTIRPFFYHQASFKCFYCNEVFTEIQTVLQHGALHSTPDRATLLKYHLRKGKRVIKVDISGLKCRICDQKYSDIDDIRKHLIINHKKEFNSAGNGLMAYDLNANNGVLTCHKCSKSFNSFFLLNRHMNVHFNVVCETCGLGFISHQRLMNHRVVHENGVYKCEKCPEVFSSKFKLRHHMYRKHEVTNVKKKPLKCPHCLERFTEHYRKMTHLKEAHDISFTFDCSVCKSVFSTRRALTEHTTKQHTQKIQCKICGKCFGTQSLLKMHCRGHTGERNFVCTICSKPYMHERTLRQHMRVHGGTSWKFTCSECGNGFHNRNEYNKHMKQWHPEWQFKIVKNFGRNNEVIKY